MSNEYQEIINLKARVLTVQDELAQSQHNLTEYTKFLTELVQTLNITPDENGGVSFDAVTERVQVLLSIEADTVDNGDAVETE